MSDNQGNGKVDAIRQILNDPNVRAELEKVADGLLTRGWHILEDGPDRATDTPVHAFTLGLYPNFHHPEIIVVGFPERITSQLLLAACTRVQAGEKFRAGNEYEGFFIGFKVAVRQVHPSNYDRFLTFVKRYYQTSDFPALQMFIPDQKGLYPWDIGVQPENYQEQRILEEPL